MRGCLVGVVLSVIGLAMTVDAGVAPIDPIRDWKVVYGSAEGPQGKALEVLTEAAGPILRDHRTSTSYVLPLEKDGGKPVARTDSEEAEGLFRRGDGGFLQFFLHGAQIVGTLRLLSLRGWPGSFLPCHCTNAP